MNEIERIRSQYKFHDHDRLIGYVEHLLVEVEKLEDKGWCLGCNEKGGECHCAEMGGDAEWVSTPDYVERLKDKIKKHCVGVIKDAESKALLLYGSTVGELEREVEKLKENSSVLRDTIDVYTKAYDEAEAKVEKLKAENEKLEKDQYRPLWAVVEELKLGGGGCPDALILDYVRQLREALEGIKHRARFSTEEDLASGIISMVDGVLKEVKP